MLTLNIFPIELPPSTVFKYRIWTIDEPPTEPKTREKIISYLWKNKLKRPVYPTVHEQRFALAVANWGPRQMVEYIGGGNQKFTISPTETIVSLPVDSLTPQSGLMVAAMLQQQINHYLSNQTKVKLVKSHQNFLFYERDPASPYPPSKRTDQQYRDSAVDIFRGFSFRTTFLENVGLCVIIDVQTNYVGKRTLADYILEGNLPSNVDMYGGFERWVVDFVNSKQSVYLHRRTESTIENIPLKNGTVYEYLLSTDVTQPNE